jgi:hypothetical protein
MRHPIGAITAFLATVVLGLGVSNAWAGRYSLSNHNFRIVWTSLEITEAEGSIGTVRCPVTLEGSFHSNTILKADKALIGHISRASVVTASCTGGSATFLQETLPWHAKYNGFIGRLPNIVTNRLLLVGVSMRIGITALFTFFCLIRSIDNPPLQSLAVAGELVRETSTGVITNYSLTSGESIGATGAGGSGCPTPFVHMKSPFFDGVVTLLGAMTRITLTLI